MKKIKIYDPYNFLILCKFKKNNYTCSVILKFYKKDIYSDENK